MKNLAVSANGKNLEAEVGPPKSPFKKEGLITPSLQDKFCFFAI